MELMRNGPQPSEPGLRGRAGFNLVETMVVLVVIGLMLVIAVPDLARRNARARVEGAAREMASHMELARQLAVSRRTPYRMVVDKVDQSYFFERQQPDSTWAMEPDEVYQTKGLNQMVTTIGGQSSPNQVHFETRGTVLSADAPVEVLFINADQDTAALTVVRTGRATVVAP